MGTHQDSELHDHLHADSDEHHDDSHEHHIDRHMNASKLRLLKWEYFTGYLLMFMLSSVLLWYIRQKRHRALMGNEGAARKAILPTFEPMISVVTFVSFLYFAFFSIVTPTAFGDELLIESHSLWFMSGINFVALLIIIFMYQKSVSRPALFRASAVTALIVAYPIPILAYLHAEDVNHDDVRVVYNANTAALVLFYLWTAICPPLRASRWILGEYSVFSIVCLVMVTIYEELVHANQLDEALRVMMATVILTSMYPIYIYRLLRADTIHWRGMGERACMLQNSDNKLLCETLSAEGLHLLIEMHRKYVIDFAFLQLLSVIGNGATAIVYKGILRSKVPVAVKVYTPSSVTEESVADFSNEAALCGSLQHPNIVTFHGMCVCPPNICLISELCQGNLASILQQNHKDETVSRIHIGLSYMLDAARAVAYLHSFTPAFIHRDIKPENFLVDSNGRVKLTDFGESRALPNLKKTKPSQFNQFQEIQTSSEYVQMPDTPANLELDEDFRRLSVHGTVDFMAPELMKARAGKASYDEGADVYSLGLTLWQILHPNTSMYPEGTDYFKIYDLVLNGHRPPIHEFADSRIKQLIENTLTSDVDMRPSANNVVHILEEVQERHQGRIARELLIHMPTRRQTTSWRGKTTECAFSGADAVLFILNVGHACSFSEAVRLGNALMDAGYMHHIKHNQPFSDSPALFYLDSDKIPGENDVFSPSNDVEIRLGSSPGNRNYEVDNTEGSRCRCQAYAQGHINFSRLKKGKKQTAKARMKLTTNLMPTTFTRESDLESNLSFTIL